MFEKLALNADCVLRRSTAAAVAALVRDCSCNCSETRTKWEQTNGCAHARPLTHTQYCYKIFRKHTHTRSVCALRLNYYHYILYDEINQYIFVMPCDPFYWQSKSNRTKESHFYASCVLSNHSMIRNRMNEVFFFPIPHNFNRMKGRRKQKQKQKLQPRTKRSENQNENNHHSENPKFILFRYSILLYKCVCIVHMLNM